MPRPRLLAAAMPTGRHVDALPAEARAGQAVDQVAVGLADELGVAVTGEREVHRLAGVLAPPPGTRVAPSSG